MMSTADTVHPVHSDCTGPLVYVDVLEKKKEEALLKYFDQTYTFSPGCLL